jgi:hypothetical protein
MKRAPITIAMALLLAACPLRPKDEETDDGADAETAAQQDDETAGADPEGSSSGSSETGAAGETGAASQTCEDELAEVKAALAACQAASG